MSLKKIRAKRGEGPKEVVKNFTEASWKRRDKKAGWEQVEAGYQAGAPDRLADKAKKDLQKAIEDAVIVETSLDGLEDPQELKKAEAKLNRLKNKIKKLQTELGMEVEE